MSRRPLPANSVGRPRPPSPAACGSVRRSPGLAVSGPSRAAPRGPPNFQRCPAPRPRRRLGFSIVGPRAGAQSARVRGPMALAPPAPAAGSFPPPPPLFSRCHSALSPALRSAPCPAALASGPETPAAGQPRLCRHLPRRALGSLFLPVSPAPVGLSVSPCGSLSSSPSPSQSVPCLPLPLPCLSPARLCLAPVPASVSLPPSHSRCGPRGLGPRPPPLPRPRLAREPELPPPAARRELPTRGTPPGFARLSPLLTRDPRPTAEAARPHPQPRSPGRPAGPGPAPSPQPSQA